MAIDYQSVSDPMTDADYRANDDAHTLARAIAIREDSERFRAAQDAARKMLNDEKQDVKLLVKVAGRRAKRLTTQTPKKTDIAHNVFKRI